MCKIRLSLPLIFGLVATLFISPEFSGAATVEVFNDSFEVSEWNGLWTEDSQNDWFRSTQRAIDGSYSAEVDGSASDAALTSIIIDLQGKTNATVTFSWFIEVQLDSGEYLAFDVSTDGGSSWVEKAILRGDVDPESTWHNESIDVTDISGGSLQIRFRAKMSRSNEDANVDLVRVTAWSPAAPAAPTGLSATAVSSSQIDLSWTDNSTDETGFKIERKTGAGGTYGQIDTVGAGITTYQNTGLSASTEYYYRVRAYNADGDSDYSNEANATTPPPGIFWEWECDVDPTTLDSNGDMIGDWVVRGQDPGTGFSGNLTTDGGLTVYTGGDTLDARPLYDATDADLAMVIKWKSLNDDTVNNWNSILWWNLDYTDGQMGRPWCWVNRSGGNTVIHMQNVTGGSSSDITVSGIDYFTMRWQINTVADTLAVYINGEESPRETYDYTLAGEAVTDKFHTLLLGSGRGYIDYLHVYAGDYDTTPPAVPTGLTATAGDAQVSLDWADNSEPDLAGYNVYRSTTPGSGYSRLNGSLLSSSYYTDNSVTNGTTYYYVVTAVDTSSNESGYSNEDSATPADMTPPAAPTGLAATAGDATVSLNWNDNGEGDLAGYNVFRSTTPGSGYSQLNGSLLSSSDYTDNSASNGTTYYYVVTAVDVATNESGYSSEVSATPEEGAAVLGLQGDYYDNIDFTNLTVTRVDATVNFNWGNDSPDPLIGADTFSIRWTGQVQPQYSETYTFYTTTDDGVRLWVDNQLIIDKWIDQGSTEWSGTISLTGEAKYDIKMEYYENGGGALAELRWSSPSRPKEIIPQSRLYSDTTPPAAPTGLTATAGDAQVSLDWADNTEPDLAGYDVYRSTTMGGPYSVIDFDLTTSEYTDNSVSNGTTYYYVVTAVDTSFNESGYSNEASATPASGGTVGTILREWWEGISGTAVSDLTSNANYPDYPTGSEEITSFEGPMDWAENYGTRIRGYIHPPASGDYTFWIASDDNSELWLSTDTEPANVTIIAYVPSWTNSREWTKYAEQQSSSIPLTGGQKYYIEALQKEGSGGDNLAVAWQGPGITQQVIDGSYLSPWWTGIGMGKGLIGNYYDNTDFTNPKVSRLDPTVNFDWGNDSPDQWMGADTFSIRWAGQVQPLYSETYTFYTTTDDGVRLWVNNQLLIDKWIDQGPTEWSSTITLTAEVKYDIKMEYYENGGGAVAKLSWSSPSQPKEIIPQNQLYSSEGPPSYDWAVDGERILNLDGTINWVEYEYVANNIDQFWVRDYFFGPKYSYYHPTPESIPTMYCNSNTDGWHLGGQTRQPTGDEFVEWYSEGGQFVLSPDVGAPPSWQPGVVQCWDGGIWGFKDPIIPPYSLLNHLTYDNVMSQYGSVALPDPGPVSQDWIDASGGTVPAPPVTVARTHGGAGVTGFMIYKNGLIGVCGTGNEYYHWGVAGYTRTCIKLPDGKVPMAAAVSGCNEFLLVTVWDTVNHKGQLAVIAINGPVVRTFDCMPHEDRPCFWGIPNWPGVKAMKLLGYVDLPFAAPMAIKISQDFVAGNGRGFCDNYGMNLDSQTERDTWYNWSGGEGKKTARCGYAVISSRAENKVAFIDLQPLFQYYRTMYFTTQANYDQTKNQGPADDQWPYTFTYAASQTPTVYSTIDVMQPTAVAAGLPWCMWLIRNGNDAMENAYVTTMDGNLLMYKVGDLMTTASGGSIGAPFNTVAIGKNPSSLDYGHGCAYGDDLFITCRGDNAVYYLYSDGSTRGVLRDSRITDAVSACGSGVGRCFRDACWHAPLLHLMDFTGRKVLNYRFHCGYPDDDSIPVGDPPNPPNESTIFEFSGEQSPPGYPFLFVRAEVI